MDQKIAVLLRDFLNSAWTVSHMIAGSRGPDARQLFTEYLGDYLYRLNGFPSGATAVHQRHTMNETRLRGPFDSYVSVREIVDQHYGDGSDPDALIAAVLDALHLNDYLDLPRPEET